MAHVQCCRAYLDIETTGFSPYRNDLTVIGICIEKGRKASFRQFVGSGISCNPIRRVFQNVNILYTYNGARFDLMFIRSKLGIDLSHLCVHRDLMYDCWSRNLYGGLKKVEKMLGIRRKLKDVDGRMAVQLWWNYRNNGCRESLKKLLEYNREDVLNLIYLRKKLNVA
ncbi:MAG: ribonuclease H-like domain-containing protein [Candidatus Aureabacteria bacterium]|nr:ribonuclease H-like domain-containing protein [Candidatus Auribacterota bacterium]